MNIVHERDATGGAAKVMLLFLAFVAALTGVAYGTYTWEHRKIDSLEVKVSSLTSELAAAKEKPPISTNYTYTSKKGIAARVYTPESKSLIASPVLIMGEVPGNWSFEASFPVTLLDANGTVIARAPAQLLGDWMTDQLVPFFVTLTVTNLPNGEGVLMLQKDNPSGLEANEDSISIPIHF